MGDDMSRRDFSKRLGKVVGGSMLAVIGVPLLILPGSGVVLILIGVGLVGQGLGIDVRGWLQRAVQKLVKKSEKNVDAAPFPAGKDAFEGRSPSC